MRYAIRDGGPSILALIVSLLLSSALSAQESRPQLGNGAVVPRRVNFSGRTRDEHGKAIAGNVVVSFAIYRGQFDDRPLWMETQNVQADAEGHYRVQLGASEASGLPWTCLVRARRAGWECERTEEPSGRGCCC